MEVRTADRSAALSTTAFDVEMPRIKLTKRKHKMTAKRLLESHFDKLRRPDIILDGFKKIMTECDSLRL